MSRLDSATAIAGAIALWAMLAASPAAQTGEGDIIVEAERLHELAQSYAGEIAAASAGADQYPRWGSRLCPSVAGLAPGEAQTMIDHIAVRAHEVGVATERTGCQPNLVIIFAPEPSRLAREIVDSRRDLLGYFGADDVATAGRGKLEAFASSERPVRWWHVSRQTTADGQQLGESRARTGRSTRNAEAITPNPMDPTPAITGSGFEGLEGVRSQGSRMRRSTRQNLSFALVIVDSPRAAAQPAEAVADYLAMAVLVQLDPDADMSAFPSILNLFTTQPAHSPTGLTAWDRAYLQGLYAATAEAASANQQRNDIARRMVEQVREE